MISVIIPTLNEKKNIKTISKKLSKLKIVTEVIFIDDNSNDGTYDEIKKLKNKKKFKGYLRKDKKRDLSKSVFVGIKKAKKNNILVMDCDLQHDTDHIPLMWKNFNKFKCDIVVGSRFMRKNFSGNFGFFRSTISNLAILFINLFFPWSSKQIQILLGVIQLSGRNRRPGIDIPFSESNTTLSKK